MKVKIKKLRDTALVPVYANPGDACFDLHYDGSQQHTMYSLGSHAELPTGLAFEIPENHVMLVFSRSGHGFKFGTRLSNCVGIIDPAYRDEVMVSLHRDRTENCNPLMLSRGDRVAQAMIIERPKIEFVVVDELDDNNRGGGIGSTGNKSWMP